MNKAKFKKKIYRKLDSSPLSESISLSSIAPNSKPKKIIPSTATQGLREKFKKTFLPLLIDVFELRQMIDNYKSDPSTNIEKSPQQILERLEELQGDIEETQRWCDGVILQIAKGIGEAKEALGEKEEGLLKRILNRSFGFSLLSSQKKFCLNSLSSFRKERSKWPFSKKKGREES